ncbi:hypothetical protein LTR62_008752 [Meristemomyces frigidus]|uniref:DOMON domain-containing protein n=1 Tax=Meristemomyces frigidus TaxID=1508187 RepID=A0AAN7YN34_9PEZI|nr:hypothetical protein LTR62_008752 [Meristemomyces frigidus]
MMSSILTTSVAALSLFGLAAQAADSSNSTPAAVFTYISPNSQYNDTTFVFALNVDKETSDVYIHMSAPSGNDWMGVGIGAQMKNSLMFVAYASVNGTGMTLSPRISTGNSEPSYYTGISCSLVYAGDLPNGNVHSNGNDATMTINAVCKNATHWPQGSLDVTSTNQPFIFGVGPGEPGGSYLQSNDLSAGLRRHEAYGTFFMDMTKATSTSSSTAGVPRPDASGAYTNSGATLGTAKADNDFAPAIHAFIMCLMFVIVFPLGALILRVFNRVILHAWVQGLGLLLVTMATAGGIVISTQYNRSKNFASAHQIIGILLILAMFSQLGLGIVHHRLFKKSQQPTIMGKIHRYLGPATILFGIINAPIGFVFAGNPHLCLPYIVIVLLIAIIYITVRFGSRICCRGRRKNQDARLGRQGAMPAGPEGYMQPDFGPSAGYGQPSYMQPPPAYARSTSYGSQSEDVPLRPYQSQQSGMGGPPADPRPMV